MTEEFQKYARDLLELLGKDEPVEVLGNAVGEVRELTEQVSADKLAKSMGPGEWSAQQVLGHLADTEMVYGVRIRMIVTQERPTIVGYDQDAWGSRFKDLDESGQQTFLRWRILREANLRLLGSLTPDEWSRVGNHSERGEESIRSMVALLAGHDRAHLDQIKRALNR